MNEIKDIELRLMKDLDNWTEVTRGLYRVIVGAKNVIKTVSLVNYQMTNTY